MKDNQLINAAELKKVQISKYDLTCPCCHELVIFKHGQYRIPHFSHKTNAICSSFSENESQAHLEGKLAFKHGLEAMGQVAVLEYNLPEIQQRADVYLPNQNLILEYQCSPISFAEMSRRTTNYKQLGIDVLWILGDRHLTAAKRLDGVAKFARFEAKLGFYIIYYSAKNQQFRIDFQIREIAGKLTSSVRLFETLSELQRFVGQPPRQTSNCSNQRAKVLLLNQLKRIQRSIVMKNTTYLDMVTACYQQGKVFVGCPIVCHGKSGEGLPIFRRSALCWRVWIVLQLFSGGSGEVSNQQLNQLFKQSVQLFGQQFAQVDDYVRFFQMEFTSFIFSLRATGYLRHTISGVQIIKQPIWFASYDQKRQYIMTAKPVVC
ncbi:competence CoiA family protein [Lentilactobacillus otakiensis DSM 19908 = JCM 15040]|uniref:Competence protein CoiA n=2 Tax=Lentilactobacillus otakiensis TaxID=481720 RepID=S4NEL2_9LACO|nr:competence CoiA family protein [Lentilactobacillus otakiensis DSM 19908 = JCM 15040]GAD17389.1 competence protein CoiA [Lentilactobacillus otakiensis DSM 19908 = JCM 15040]